VKNLCAVRNTCIIDPDIWEEKDISSALDRFEALFTDIKKTLIASPDSFLIAESQIPHRIGITGIK
jgi:hypothetical protein